MHPEVAREWGDAVEAMRAGDLEGALRGCLRLERLEPHVADWPRRTAKVYRRMDRVREEVDALDRAAALLIRKNDANRAAGVFKQILELDPNHGPTRTRMQAMSQGRRAPPVSVAPVAEDALRQAEARGLSCIAMHRVIRGARLAEDEGGADAGTYSIPLGDAAPFERSIELPVDASVVEEFAPGPAGGYGFAEGDGDPFAAVAEEVRTAQRTDGALAAVPLFSELSDGQLSQLLTSSELVRLEENETLFRQGDAGDALFVVVDGVVGVIDEGPPRRGLSKLKEGDFFGEIALLTEQPRTATITALESSEVLRIRRGAILRVAERDPEILAVLLRFFRDRSVARLLTTHPLFSSLSASDHRLIADRFRFLEVEEGTPIVRTGRVPAGLSVIISGSAEVLVRADESDGEVQVGALGRFDFAGEEAAEGRVAEDTVRAQSKCFVLQLAARDLKKLVAARPKARAFVDLAIAKRTRARRAAGGPVGG